MKLSDIQKIIKDFEKSSLTELSLEFEDTKINLSKKQETSQPQTSVVPAQQAETIAQTQSNTSKVSNNVVKSPLVGTFYAASSPKSKPYVEVGTKVNKGDVLCLVEAMKIMNEITAPKDGVILKIHALNGQVVGIDDPLFDLE
ncbi:MAG: acetyl-CoA carboxylase biotin carboxyl carrier protein [Acholeplasmataceae bacterium]